MSDLNQITIIGNVGQKPQERNAGGKNLYIVSVCTNRNWKDKNNEWHTQPSWFDIQFWGKLPFDIQKGDKLFVQGSMENKQWTDQAGNKRDQWAIRPFKCEKIDSQKQGSQSNGYQNRKPDYHATNENAGKQVNYDPDSEDDDMPF